MKMPFASALSVAFAGSLVAGTTNLLEYTFTTGPEAWQMVDLPDGSSFTTAVPPTALVWTNLPGAGPQIQISDATSGTIFFSAPPALLTALTNAYGGFLEFELATTHQSYGESNFAIVQGSLNGQTRVAVAPLGRLPGADWSYFNLRLVPGTFRLDSPNGPPISARDLRTLLRTARALWLPAEYGNGPIETSRLRLVRLGIQDYLAVQCVPTVTLDGVAGTRFRVEYLEAIGTAGWQPLTNITLTGGPFVYFDQAAVDGPQRFYRAVELLPR